MRSQLVIGSGFVAKYPNGGGIYWIPLQYLRGFRDLGVDAFWLEVLEGSGDERLDRLFIDTFLERAIGLGIAEWTGIAFYPHGQGASERLVFGLDAAELDARIEDAALLNLAGSVNRPLREPFARTILFDLDPALFQIWAEEWGPASMGIGEHDVHLTLGQSLGSAGSAIPQCGVEWHKTWPAVHIPSWPMASPAPQGCYTTVSQWWSPESASLNGEYYDCSKRNSFVTFLDVPQRTGVCFELAANIHPSEAGEKALLSTHGWRLVEPEQIVRTPQQYRGYIEASRGEFSCAKPAYVKADIGWLSDRTVCYLASGRPCIVQDTGASRHLPKSRGLRFFCSSDEAALAIVEVESDYGRASMEARSMACEWFSTDVLLPPLLTLAGL